MDLLYFEPEVKKSEIPVIIDAVRILYPGIRWMSGSELENIAYVTDFNSLIIRDTTGGTGSYTGPSEFKSSLKLSWGNFDSKNDLARFTLGNNWEDADIKDGWEHLGLKQDIDSIFDSLSESKLIRKIIKESIDEFDWVDTNIYNSGQGLYNLIQDFLKTETNGKYYLKTHQGSVELSDNTGIYYGYNSMDDFTIENIVTKFKRTLSYYKDSPNLVVQEYRELAKALEPIIGPINVD
jgi:hypothetical protein